MMQSPLLSVEASTSSHDVAAFKPTSPLKQQKQVPAYALYLLIAIALTSTLLSLLLASAYFLSAPSAASPLPLAGPSGFAAKAPATALNLYRADGDQPNVLVPNVPRYPANTLMGQIKSHDLLHLLSGLYATAMNQGGGNRAITGTGFNASVDYLYNLITTRTNLVNIEKSYFLRAGQSSGVSNAAITVKSPGKPLPPPVYLANWRTYGNTAAASNASWASLYFIDNGGCSMDDWTSVLGDSPSTPFYAIVYRDTACTDTNRIGFAQYYSAAGIIIVSTQQLPGLVAGNAPSGTRVTAVSMTNAYGAQLIGALQTYGTVDVQIAVNVAVTYTSIVVTNICGDTPAGDPTSVVVVGGHSDGVAAGPGTNDDGSGSIGTLALAIALTNLMRNTSVNYRPVNMVKFCWFGAEEQGLLGSQEVVRVGLQRDNDPSARVGSRAKDWAIMIDLDMLGSMNFQNYVYDANVYIPPSTPSRANNGSKIMSNLFFAFFDENGLPRDSDRFDGRSDYGPFLVAGIPAGGVDAGADKTKTAANVARYQAMTGWGGVANAINDQCYHRACDHIGNIHWGVYTNMTQSAAYVLDKLATRNNLRQYLGNPLDGAQGEPGKYDMLPLEFRYGPEVRESDVVTEEVQE